MKSYLTIQIDEKFKNIIKQFADECGCSMKIVVQTALVDLLKKNNKELPIINMK